MSKNYELLRQIDSQRKEVRTLPTIARSSERRAAPKITDESDFDLQPLLRRRVWIYYCTAGMLALAALVCVFMTPRYTAVSQIEMLKQDTGNLALGTAGSSEEGSDGLNFNLNLQTQIAVLKSDTLAWQVLKGLNLTGPTQSAEPTSDKNAAKLLKNFQKNLKVDAVSGTRLIEVSYTDRNPKMAADVVNRLVSDFVEYTFQVRYNATNKATEFLRQQMVDLKSQVEKSQERAAQLEKDSGIFGQDEHHNIVLTRLEQLNNEVTTAEADRVIKQNIYKLSQSGNPELVASISGGQGGTGTSDILNSAAVINNLRQQEATLNAEYADASSKYGPAYPRLIQLKERLDSVRTSIAKELRKMTDRAKNGYELAAARENAAKQAFADQKAVAARMNDKATDYLIAKHEADSSRVLYEQLLGKLKEADVLAGLHSSKLHVVDMARPPIHPSRPNVPLYLALGVVAGMGIGVICAFVAEAMDRTVRDVEGIEASTYIPVLGVTPQSVLPPKAGLKRLAGGGPGRGDGNSLVESLRNPSVAEAFRSLRTSILLSQPGEPAKIVMVTSGMAQEGKSFTSLNLAAALARNGSRVLLVDADLRRGTLSRALDQDSGMGLSQVLSADVGPEDAYRMIDEIPGVTFLSAGKTPRCKSELLESELMSAVLENWRDRYDFVVIDTPPVLPVTDAVALSPKVDFVVVVVRFAVTNQQSILRTVRLLKNARAAQIGVLVNAMNVRSPEFYRYYGSGGYDVYQNGDADNQLLVPPSSKIDTERESA